MRLRLPKLKWPSYSKSFGSYITLDVTIGVYVTMVHSEIKNTKSSIHGKSKATEVNRKHLLGGQFLINFAPKSRKIINWVDSL